MQPPLNLANRIHDLRKRVRLSHAEMGRAFGVEWRSVALWELGLGEDWSKEVEQRMLELLDALNAVTSRRLMGRRPLLAYRKTVSSSAAAVRARSPRRS
jgi:DNA-binding XRE family transcriptional regulator